MDHNDVTTNATRSVVFALAFVCALAGATVTARAAEAPAEKKLVTNTFLQTSLGQVLSDISAQTGVPVLAAREVQGIVSCELNRVPLPKALNMVLAGTGFAVHRTADYYLVYSPDPESPAFIDVSDTQVIRLKHVDAEMARKLLPASYQKYVQAAKEEDTVCVVAPEKQMQRIVAALEKMDQPRRHVILEARIVVLDRSDLLDMGVQWDWPEVLAGTFYNDRKGTGLGHGWGVQLGYTPGRTFTNALALTLNLLTQNDEASVLARPKVMAQDGKPAEIKVNTEEYFEVTTDGYYSQADLEKIETGTILTIVPRVNDDDEITLTIETEVSDVVARGEDNLPVVTRRQAKSTLRVEDGGTAVVAGLMDNRSRQVHDRVPFLGRIPGIGELFHNVERKNESRQCAVFVTASLVKEKKTDEPEVRPERVRIEPVSAEEFRPKLVRALAELDEE